jgi:hypothetical protein
MRLLKLQAGLLFTVLVTVNAHAQRIKVTEGNLDALKSESSINVEFTYDNMRVGKFDNEKDYVNKKTEEYNKKEAGRGDSWAKSWVADRKNQFEPKFTELFEKNSKMSTSNKAKYTLILKTTFTEPGFNIYITRKNAKIDGDILIVETANRDKVLAKLTLDDALGRTFGGGDFDTGTRIAEAYADAGKAIGKKIK